MITQPLSRGANSCLFQGAFPLLKLLQYDNYSVITYAVTKPRDPTLDVLLDLGGQVLVVDPAGGSGSS